MILLLLHIYTHVYIRIHVCIYIYIVNVGVHACIHIYIYANLPLLVSIMPVLQRVPGQPEKPQKDIFLGT